MPTLLQINITANLGSHGRIAEEIGQLVISRGWESFIAYGRNANPSQSQLIHIGNMWDERWHGLQSRLFDNHGLASKNATKNLIEKIQQIKPDLIHLHNIHGYYLNYPMLFQYLSALSIPIVWTLHDCWPFTGHCVHPTYAKCMKWHDSCSKCPLKQDYPQSVLMDNSSRNFAKKKDSFTGLSNLHIVTVSKWLEKEVKKSFLKDYDIRCIYNGVNLNIFHPHTVKIRYKYNIPDGSKLVLGVSNVWNDRKGLDDFFKLRELLPEQYVILLVGLTKKQIQKLPSRIIGVERTNSVEELAEIYSMADCYVNPSMAETFGMTTAEALACGTPAIVYNTTACPELVDKSTGRVVDFGDITTLVNNIIDLCHNSADNIIKQQCRLRAEALFDKNERYMEYFELYNSLLK